MPNRNFGDRTFYALHNSAESSQHATHYKSHLYLLQRYIITTYIFCQQLFSYPHPKLVAAFRADGGVLSHTPWEAENRLTFGAFLIYMSGICRPFEFGFAPPFKIIYPTGESPVLFCPCVYVAGEHTVYTEKHKGIDYNLEYKRTHENIDNRKNCGNGENNVKKFIHSISAAHHLHKFIHKTHGFPSPFSVSTYILYVFLF